MQRQLRATNSIAQVELNKLSTWLKAWISNVLQTQIIISAKII